MYGSSQLWLCCERKQKNSGLKSIETLPENWFRKEAGCREDSSDDSKCQACHKEEGTEKHRLYHCPEWYEVRHGIPDAFRKWEQKTRTSKEEWKWQRGIVTPPLSESQWNRDHFSVKKWESEKDKSCGVPAEGFKGHVATDGSLLGTAGKWRACVWSVMQLDYDGELGPLHGMCGSMEAELAVQRTIKKMELTAFLCLLKKVIGTIKVHVDKGNY